MGVECVTITFRGNQPYKDFPFVYDAVVVIAKTAQVLSLRLIYTSISKPLSSRVQFNMSFTFRGPSATQTRSDKVFKRRTYKLSWRTTKRPTTFLEAKKQRSESRQNRCPELGVELPERLFSDGLAPPAVDRLENILLQGTTRRFSQGRTAIMIPSRTTLPKDALFLVNDSTIQELRKLV